MGGAGAHNNSILSDSDDRHSFALAFKLRQTPMGGNFESDSLNENFSPSRPNIRRKRKFKRMAVEYETTPSTPHTTTHPIFPISGTVTKKRVLKHNQENFRSNLFFGKRKRPHRDRYEYYEHKTSSSVPRQRGYLSQKDGLSYLEYKSRNRASSMSTAKSGIHGQTAMEKILPLNKSIVSKIEKIAQDSRRKMNFNFTSMQPVGTRSDQIDSSAPVVHFQSSYGGDLRSEVIRNSIATTTAVSIDMDMGINATDDVKIGVQKMTQKAGSFESTLLPSNTVTTSGSIPIAPTNSSSSSTAHLNSSHNIISNCINNIIKKKVKHSPTSGYLTLATAASTSSSSSHHHHHHIPSSSSSSAQHHHQPTHHLHHHHHHHNQNHKHKQSRRKMQLQFDDQADFMDCGNFNDFLSSSSLSSSDSETEETNESDHEGDDELTDWPGHEAMINFASKNEFKRANNKKAMISGNKLPQIKQQDDIIIQDDDTLMSADELQEPTTSEESPVFPLGGGSFHNNHQLQQQHYQQQQQQMHQTAVNTLEEYHRKYGMPSHRIQASHPINIIGALESNMMQGSSSTSGVVADGGYGSSFAASSYNYKQPIESEMSGVLDDS